MTTVDNSPGTKKVRPFGIRDKVGYMFGDFGNDFSFILQAFFFMAFYTKIVGIDPAHVGLVLLLSKLLDAFTDVGWGRFLDTRKPGSAGKFRPWILRGAIPVAVASALMYMTFIAGWESYGARLTYMIVTSLLWGSITYTMINIPYGSMASVISSNPNDRAQLSVWRSTGAALAALVISVVVPGIVNVTDEAGNSVLSGERLMWSAIIMSALAVVFYIICYSLTTERVKEAPKQEHIGFGQMLGSLARNKPLGGILVAALLLLVGSLLPGALVAFLWLDYFNAGGMQSIASLLGFAPAILLIFVAPWLARRFGKRETAVVALTFGGILMIVAYVLNLQGSPWTYIVLFALAQLMVSLFNFLIWAFITDVIDFQEVQTGERDDATIYGIYSWARKLGQALAQGLGGFALGWVGYQATQGGEQIVQSDATLNGIYMFSTLIPGIFYILVALSLQFLYPLSRRVVEKNAKILVERREEAKAASAPGATEEA